jgi:hypothetical protein
MVWYYVFSAVIVFVKGLVCDWFSYRVVPLWDMITALNTQYHTTVRKEQKEQNRVDLQWKGNTYAASPPHTQDHNTTTYKTDPEDS